MKFLALFCWIVGLAAIADAADEFAFASYYQNHMVLQREPNRAVIWGYGAVGAIVNVSIIQDVYSTKVRLGPDGKGVWSVTLSPRPVGGAQQIQGVQDNNGLLSWILLKDVLFGDVWICSGQSNMQFTVSMMFNSSYELEHAHDYTDIRVMTVGQKQSNASLYDLLTIEEPWQLPSNKTLGGGVMTYFSAVCWLYGRNIYDQLKVPVGLIASDWGGTPIETWSSPLALQKCNLNQRSFDAAEHPELSVVPHDNSVLWNAMIHPLLNMTIKGAIWYQGEANANYHADKYGCLFPAMIGDWRRAWHASHEQTDQRFPFGFVQLATWNATDDGGFPKIRWHQTADYGFVPNTAMPDTFMAVAMDLRDDASPYGSVHPRYKEEVGRRLALAGLHVAYGKPNNPNGPVILSAVRTDDTQVVINYSRDQNLVVMEQKNFEICCSFSKCNIYEPSPSDEWVTAPIITYSARTVTVESKYCHTKGGQAYIIRYAWALEPCEYKKCSVYNDLGLPAPPFATYIIDYWV